jgi:hypothetical protein
MDIEILLGGIEAEIGAPPEFANCWAISLSFILTLGVKRFVVVGESDGRD